MRSSKVRGLGIWKFGVTHHKLMSYWGVVVFCDPSQRPADKDGLRSPAAAP